MLEIFPVTGVPPEACEAALRKAQELPPLPFGAALHLGEIPCGNIGAADRLDFPAIGPAVNLVSRLERLCRPLGRSVLISGAVAAETTAPLVPLEEHVLRGIAAPCADFSGRMSAVAVVTMTATWKFRTPRIVPCLPA